MGSGWVLQRSWERDPDWQSTSIDYAAHLGSDLRAALRVHYPDEYELFARMSSTVIVAAENKLAVQNDDIQESHSQQA